jgi:hypothetical protein
MKCLIAMTAIVLAAGSTLAQADVYRRVDDQGRVIYTDRWVPGAVLIRTEHRTSTATPAPAATNRAASAANPSPAPRAGADPAQPAAASSAAPANETPEQRLEREANERTVQQDLAAERDKQCKEAQQRYQNAIQARRVYRTGPNGEREYLSEAVADQHRMQARSEMKTACGGAS